MRAQTYMLVAFAINGIGCGKTDSKSSFGTATLNNQATPQFQASRSTAGSKDPESETAAPPQSVAGAYLTCAPYSTPSAGAKEPSLMGCMVIDNDDQRIAISSFPNRAWRVKDDGNKPLAVKMTEMKNDPQADVLIFTNISADKNSKVASVEFRFDTKNSGPTIEYKFKKPVDLTKDFSGKWTVVRSVGSGGFDPSRVITNKVRILGELQINFTDEQNFEAVVTGPANFTLDYNYSAQPGTKLFTGTVGPSSDRAELALLKTKVIPDPTLTIMPLLTLDRATGKAVMKVTQPYYGDTTWELSRPSNHPIKG